MEYRIRRWLGGGLTIAFACVLASFSIGCIFGVDTPTQSTRDVGPHDVTDAGECTFLGRSRGVCKFGRIAAGDAGTEWTADADTSGLDTTANSLSGGRQCAPPPSYEVDESACDDRDNDCDSVTDEGCSCPALGRDRGVCTEGTRSELDGECEPPSSYESDESSCDSKDNDCDGTTDENCFCLYNGNNKGVCANGKQTEDGCKKPSSFEMKETSDDCDGKDNDCDGMTDEECMCQKGQKQTCYSGPDDTEGTGICEDGTKTCTDDGWPDQCKNEQTPKSMETCGDAKDNDCDGTTDEGCTCKYQGSGDGVCGDAKLGPKGNCEKPKDYQSDESDCDGKDNDCDGTTDEDCDCNFMGSSEGVCQSGTVDPKSGTCTKPADYESPESSCDSKDNDCDGKTDDADSNLTCSCNPGTTESCYTASSETKGVGICSAGTKTCKSDSTWGKCNNETTPKKEGGGSNCDEKDSDCDGTTDEGCFCAYDPSDTDNIDSDGDNNTGVCSGQKITTDGVCPKPNAYESSESTCTDSLDNDCDGDTDCADSDCGGSACGSGSGAVCKSGTCTETKCNDGSNNDKNQGADCADPDCSGASCGTGSGASCQSGACQETACGDGTDNDEDGNTDCADPDCTGETCAGSGSVCTSGDSACHETNCSDGTDNDGDGDIDCADGDCPSCGSGATCNTSSGACEETNCGDGTDNDGDGNTDCGDGDCSGEMCNGSGTACNSGSCTETACSDDTDNDGDGSVDACDSDCTSTCGSGASCSAETSGVCSETNCGDGTDNDSDGNTDCGDGDCSGDTCNGSGTACSSGACTETACSDDSDNDGDGAEDCSDSDCPGCPSGSTCVSGDCVETNCSDSKDNDNDGATNCKDGDCDGDACGTGSGAVCHNDRCNEIECGDGNDNDEDGNTDTAGDKQDCDKSGLEWCKKDGQCHIGVCTNANECAQTIFATSKTYGDGDFGGVGNMDTECGNVAGSNRPGTWKAIVSTTKKNARNRVTVGSEVYNTNGDRVADNQTDLWNGNLDTAVGYDESGSSLLSSMNKTVWTGSTEKGRLKSSSTQCTSSAQNACTCNDWTSSSYEASLGAVDLSSGDWLDTSILACTTSDVRLYCIDGQQ